MVVLLLAIQNGTIHPMANALDMTVTDSGAEDGTSVIAFPC